jgi:hypothetical protein
MNAKQRRVAKRVWRRDFTRGIEALRKIVNIEAWERDPDPLATLDLIRNGPRQ